MYYLCSKLLQSFLTKTNNLYVSLGNTIYLLNYYYIPTLHNYLKLILSNYIVNPIQLFLTHYLFYAINCYSKSSYYASLNTLIYTTFSIIPSKSLSLAILTTVPSILLPSSPPYTNYPAPALQTHHRKPIPFARTKLQVCLTQS